MSRHHNINGNIVPFTAEEEAQRDAEEAAFAEAQANIIPTPAYVSQRKSAYPSIGEQLDMQYWDKVNGTTTWKDAVAKVKADNPKN